MAHCIHGEVKMNGKSIGQLSDLVAILITNGYTVQIAPKEDLVRNTKEFYITIMTEVE